MQGNEINGLISAAIPDFGSPTLQGMEFEPGADPNVLEMKGSRRQFVKFYEKIFYDAGIAKKLKAQGKDLSLANKKVLMVKVVTPGDKTEFDAPAEDYHKRAFARQYRAFREGKTTIEGRSVEDCEFITQPEATELLQLGIYTLEQLADASDSACETMPRGFDLREHAKNWYEAEYGKEQNKKVSELGAALNDANAVIAEQAKALEAAQKAIAELRGAVNEIQEEKRGPGRPRKNDIAN